MVVLELDDADAVGLWMAAMKQRDWWRRLATSPQVDADAKASFSAHADRMERVADDIKGELFLNHAGVIETPPEERVA